MDIRRAGSRWTKQRETLVAILRASDGYVLAAELIERCRAVDPTTTPSTVYRTLNLLENLGLVWRGRGPAGREKYRALSEIEHGHLHCETCGGLWEIRVDEAAAIAGRLDQDCGFAADLGRVTISGRCGTCREPAAQRSADRSEQS